MPGEHLAQPVTPPRESEATTGRVLAELSAPTPGPTVIVLGAVHGNEPAGVEAARSVLDQLGHHTPTLAHGTLIGLIGNLACFNTHDKAARYLDRDLNRTFTTEQLRAASRTPGHERTAEQTESLQLLEELQRLIAEARGPVHLLDLHTTSAPSCPFCVLADALPSRELALRLGLPITLGLEEELEGVLVDYASETLGVVSVLVEGGQHDTPESVEVLEQAIWVTLHGLGMVELGREQLASKKKALRLAAGNQAGSVYDIRHREPVTHEDLVVPEELESFSKVRANHTVIATQGGKVSHSPESGYALMPNRQPRKRIGDDAVFVADHIGASWLRLSARLRRSDRVHRWLPRLAPGVRRRPGHERELLIAPEIAAVLKRELFHLFGYRLVRHSKHQHLHGLKRAAQAWAALCSAFVSMLTGTFSTGEPTALHDERDEDWIVRRRRLDVEPPAGTRG